jgi:CheY-like chemotaxis protein
MPNELQSRYIGVIVVDDHDLVRRGVTSALAELPDMRVLGEAASGEEAIRLVREKLPDVVLMDLRMPGMGGLEAARRIGITHPQTCVIAVTAWDSEPWQRLEQSHIAACVGKSVRVADLGATIRRALVSHRRGDRAHAINEPSCNPFDTLSARAFLRTLTELPGVYQMYDAAGALLYVGKARNLRKRVASYFRPGRAARPWRWWRASPRSRSPSPAARPEALLLEQNLIKSQHPPLQHPPARRQILSLHLPVRRGSTLPALASIAAPSVQNRALFRPLSQLRRRCVRASACCRRCSASGSARTAFSATAPAPACSTRSAAARRPASA